MLSVWVSHKQWIPAILLLVLLAPTRALALSDSEVDSLSSECEAARQVALEPIRERRTQACIEQQLRSPEHCERYYKTYGNVSPGPSGAPNPGIFYDLPECVTWLDAREALRESRSRP